MLGTLAIPGYLMHPDQPVPINYPAPAYCSNLGIYEAVVVPIENTLTNSITVIVFSVLSNSAGQTLEVSTATITLAPGQYNEPAYVITMLAYGNYSADIFVWTTTGAAIAPPETFTLTC